MQQIEHHKVVIIGGGSAGISLASRLVKKLKANELAIVEPASKHYYQPLWTLVGAGVFPKQASERQEASLIPQGVKWIKDSVVEIVAEENMLVTASGAKLKYDYLVVAAGIQVDWDKIPGLVESLGKNGVCSNYSYESVESTWKFIKNFQGGTAVFTQPNTAIKCGGAPQKIAYLAEDYFRLQGLKNKCKIVFASANPTIFSVKKYADKLNKVLQRKQISTMFRHNLVELHADKHEAVFQNLDTQELVTVKYDMIHVTPPMSAPDFIKKSSLADSAGWVDVDKHNLRHTKYANVFAIGDSANLPTSKTGAAIRKQVPVLLAHLLAAINGTTAEQRYDGYTSCPLVTGYDKMILAEFDYELNPAESFPFDQSKERYSMYLLKKYLLPRFYWDGMLKGRL